MNEPAPVSDDINADTKLPIARGNKPVTLDERSITGPLAPMAEEIQGSAVTAVRVWMHRQSRFNPIRNLKPQLLSQQIDSFDIGVLAPFARTMEAISRTDDAIKSVTVKRKSAVKQMSYSIVVDPDIDPSQKAEADEHVKVLKYFYKNAKVTNAIDRDQHGGFSLLVDQMMDALLFKYACHELLWEPVPGEGLCCTFNYVPLYFFENQTGEMRYLPSEGAYQGVPLEKNAWMISCSEWLMRCAAVCYIYKHLSLKDWVLYNERHGMPAVVAKTMAQIGSAAWNSLAEGLRDFGANFSAVMNKDDEIVPIDTRGTGELPYPPLVERMDRFISILFRGGDLSTISNNSQGVGSNPQQDDANALKHVDAQFISETLKYKIDPLVIAYHFGAGVKPLANVQLSAPDPKDVNNEIAVDRHLLDNGLDLHKKDMYERYGRTMPEADAKEEELVRKQEDPNNEGSAGDQNKNKPRNRSGRDQKAFANETRGLNRGEASHVALIRNAMARASDAENSALEPLWERLDGLMQILDGTDEKAAEMALRKFQVDLPELQKAIARNPAGARAFEAIQASALLNGLAEGHVSRN